MREYNFEWNSICRVCLQEPLEGANLSIFNTIDDNYEIDLAEMIMRCCSIVLTPAQNLPNYICNKCFSELQIAYKFRLSFEFSENVLKSYIANKKELLEPTSPEETSERLFEVVYSNPVANETDSTSDLVFQEEEDTQSTVQEDNLDEKYSFYVYEEEDGEIDELEPEVTPELEEEVTENGVDFIEEDTNTTTDMILEEEEVVKSSQGSNGMVSEITCLNTYGEEVTVMVEKVAPVKQATKVKRRKADIDLEDDLNSGTTPWTGNKKQLDDKEMNECEICGNTYRYRHALEIHMRRHRNERPFPCEICGKAFVIKFELDRHTRVHTGKKPYGCKYCDKTFSDFGTKTKHERTHTGERPYICSYCGKSFTYSHVLSSHLLIHTGVKNYECDQCGKKFTKSHHLKSHKNSHLKAELRKFKRASLADIMDHPDDLSNDILTRL